MNSKKRIVSVDLTVVTSNRTPQGGNLRSEHGFSALLEIEWSDLDFRTILFDTGASGEVLEYNLGQLEVLVADIDWVILSHSHGDHTGGLQWLLSQPDGDFVVVSHPEIDRAVYKTEPSLSFSGMSCDAIRELGPDRWVKTSSPLRLEPGVWVTGEIPRRNDFELPRKSMINIRDGKHRVDGEIDDLAIVLDLGDSGSLVVAGCCHAGVVNTAAAAHEILPDRPVRAVVGGFHLYNAEEDVLQRTAVELRKLVHGGVISGHCTGQKGEDALTRVFGKRHKAFYSGDSWRFEADGEDWVFPSDVPPR
ncbi:MAG: MBL fold metallo-hydrolase [Clostridia bacterium]